MGTRKRQRLYPGGMRVATLTRERRKAIAIRARRQQIRDMMLQGIYCQELIAARLGCSQPTVSNDIKAIFRLWIAEDIDTTHEEVLYRVKQLELGAHESYTAFQRSKQNTEHITTEYVKVMCPKCGGKGSNGKPCVTCDGAGTVVQENVIRKLTGQAGDASHMSNYLRFVREAAKIKGLYQKPIKKVQHQHVHITNIDWERVPAEQLLRMKQECNQLLAYGNTVVDVKSATLKEP